MLCRAVDSEESLRETAEATRAGLIFMDRLERKAQVRRLEQKPGEVDALERCELGEGERKREREREAGNCPNPGGGRRQ